MNNRKAKVFLVDDDALYLKTLELQFKALENFEIQTFITGEQCIENLHLQPDIIVLDYWLNGIEKNAMNGLNTLDIIKQRNADIAVIMLSSQDSIEIAINCMHHLAMDYVVKSETAFLRLQKIFDGIIRFKVMESELNWYMDRM
ncbi:MAG: response regulator [Saprospiraceae bacterium]|nr:response regulator [Saprospiraceae bacterium]MBK8450098.1 response regulator [Saprospiraceae bacterium]MBK8483808.1 response regulator [Saprospiraceae bacterium]MBK9221259.1 response regulator [Saprospiraceae bacterium]MBK9721807.1 response regulator [Saprospiraceae bacterium]